MARVYIECPPGRGPGRILITAWTAAGYLVTEQRCIGTGERLLLIRGGDDSRVLPAPHASSDF